MHIRTDLENTIIVANAKCADASGIEVKTHDLRFHHLACSVADQATSWPDGTCF